MSDSAVPKTACECQARMLQLISGSIGLMNHSEFQQTVLKWWQAAMPELAKSFAPCPCEGLQEDEPMRRDYRALHEQLLSRFVAAFPNYAWTGSESAIDLMAAEITTARAERDQLRAALAEALTPALCLKCGKPHTNTEGRCRECGEFEYYGWRNLQMLIVRRETA